MSVWNPYLYTRSDKIGRDLGEMTKISNYDNSQFQQPQVMRGISLSIGPSEPRREASTPGKALLATNFSNFKKYLEKVERG